MLERSLQEQLDEALRREKQLLKNQEKYDSRFKELEEKINKLQKTINQIKADKDNKTLEQVNKTEKIA